MGDGAGKGLCPQLDEEEKNGRGEIPNDSTPVRDFRSSFEKKEKGMISGRSERCSPHQREGKVMKQKDTIKEWV